MEIEWTGESRAFMASAGHVICLGGPGSGKTTIALLKAKDEIGQEVLTPGQHILFLSFARATISRVGELAATLLKGESISELNINTYHGFSWSILRSHGYLLTSASPIKLLSPPNAAAHLSSIKGCEEKKKEKHRLFTEEGRLHFDLFASCAADLLNRSSKIRNLISQRYPIIILDEFQDTDPKEWILIQALGQASRIIALADPEQRIYEFRGASSTRIPEFITQFNPREFNFLTANYRSSGTDICDFGNDLLTGANRMKRYNNVEIKKYPFRQPPEEHIDLKITVLKRRKEILDINLNIWSLAVLVPTKSLMLEVSEYLMRKQKLNNGEVAPSIDNEPSLDAEGPALAAVTIATVLSGEGTSTDISQRLILSLCQHIRGRKKPTKKQLGFAVALEAFVKTGAIRGSTREALRDECLSIAERRLETSFTGDLRKDWLLIRSFFEEATSPDLKNVASDARFLKFLNRGTQLRSRLSEIWRTTDGYSGAEQAVDQALTIEHFAAATQPFQGVHVMTIHKSKGKQFTEVIIYEGPTRFRDRIVRANGTDQDVARSKRTLRVGVTRAEKFVSILSPEFHPCPLI